MSRAWCLPLLIVALASVLVPAPVAAEDARPPESLVLRYGGPAGGTDLARDVAVDPATGIAVVTGYVEAPRGDRYDLVTIAYAADGRPLWRRTVTPQSVLGDVVGIDSTRGIVYVGANVSTRSVASALVAAYGLDGTLLWQREFDDATSGLQDLKVDETRGRVYVVGESAQDVVTVAYDVAGTELWNARYSDPTGSILARQLAVDTTSGAVYLAGSVLYPGDDSSWLVVAYRADGQLAWVDTSPQGDERRTYARAVAADFTTGTVFVSGVSERFTTGDDVMTVAYTADGQRRWVQQFDSGDGRDDRPEVLAFDPGVQWMFVSGTAGGRLLTVAYTANGALLWSDRRTDEASDGEFVSDIALDPDRQQVYVTGTGGFGVGRLQDYLTVDYTFTGAFRGLAVYGGLDIDNAFAVAVDPVRHTVWVTGRSNGLVNGDDWVTLAYFS